MRGKSYIIRSLYHGLKWGEKKLYAAFKMKTKRLRRRGGKTCTTITKESESLPISIALLIVISAVVVGNVRSFSSCCASRAPTKVTCDSSRVVKTFQNVKIFPLCASGIALYLYNCFNRLLVTNWKMKNDMNISEIF